MLFEFHGLIKHFNFYTSHIHYENSQDLTRQQLKLNLLLYSLSTHTHVVVVVMVAVN